MCEDLPRESGRALSIVELSCELAGRRNDVSLLCGPIADAGLLSDAAAAGCRVYVFPGEPLSCFRTEDRGFAAWVRNRLAVLRPDVAHTHGYGDLWAVAQTGVPYIASVHTQSGWAAERLPTLVKLLTGAGQVLAHGRNATADLVAAGLGADRIVTTASGVRAHGPQPVRHVWWGEPQLVCVSRLDYNKGIDTLIRAMPAILAAHPLARLALIGRGIDEGAFRALAAGTGVDGAIDWLGHRPRAVELLGGIDLMCHPSLFEGCSTAVLEAMACEVPVCVSQTSAEATADGLYGELHARADHAALASAALRCLSDPGRFERARRGGAFVRSRWSFDSFVALSQDAYRIALLSTP